MKKPVYLLVLFVSLFHSAKASDYDSLILTNHVFGADIKSVLLFRDGWQLSYPVIALGSEDKLLLQFDELKTGSGNYEYTFIHCDKDWKISDLVYPDFLEGFEENRIEDFRPSFNTTVKYWHYELRIPNGDISFKISGNYIIIVYPFGDRENPLLTRRFMITERSTGITADAERSQVSGGYESQQQVSFSVDYTGMAIIDPLRNIYSTILQNGRWDNAKSNIKPDLAGNNKLIYNTLSERNIFPGGNEYRNFDIKSIRYKSEFIRAIEFLNQGYNVFLYPSENRESKQYFYNPDLNGKYYIASDEGRNPATDADYLNVYFTMPALNKTGRENIYVAGGFNDWTYDNTSKMTYNPVTTSFENTLLLKQGWYNYEYIFLKQGVTSGEPTLFEGSHYETENDYLILVYYRSQRDRYDRLLFSESTNSINRNSGQ